MQWLLNVRRRLKCSIIIRKRGICLKRNILRLPLHMHGKSNKAGTEISPSEKLLRLGMTTSAMCPNMTVML